MNNVAECFLCDWGLSVFSNGTHYVPCVCVCIWRLYLDNSMHGIDRVCMGINTLSRQESEM